MEVLVIIIGLLILGFLTTKGNIKKKKKNINIKLYEKYSPSILDYELHNIIDKYRRENSLYGLQFTDRLCDVAYSHSKWMAENKQINHNNMIERSENFEEVYSEIIGYNFQDAESFVRAWVGSDKHNEKLLNNRATKIGIGSEKDEKGRIYVTVTFLNYE